VDPARSLVTPRRLVQAFADRHGIDAARLGLPATAVLVPVYPLFRKLAHVLKATPLDTWAWKRPPLYVFDLDNGEKGVLACCPVGAPNAVIALEELAAFGVRILYFLGFAGGIDGKVAPGSLVLPPYAHVGEGTTRYYRDAPLTFPDRGMHERVKRGLERTAGEPPMGCPAWTTDALYREWRDEVAALARAGVCCVDMETSAVFGAADVLSVRAVALLWVSDILTLEGWTPHFHEDALKEGVNRYAEAFAVFLKNRETG